MNLRERTQAILLTCGARQLLSIRRIAAATGMTKSSVHRHRQAIERRNQYRVAVVGDAEWSPMAATVSVGSGICIRRQAWHRNDTLSEFFQLLRLERHIGYRLAPCRGVQSSWKGRF